MQMILNEALSGWLKLYKAKRSDKQLLESDLGQSKTFYFNRFVLIAVG